MKFLSTAISLLFSLSVFSSQNVVSYPSQVLDLTNWKITLPIDVDNNNKPDEILQAALSTYSQAEYFHVNTNVDGVIFKAHAGGFTTDNSGYPRSELREMTSNGTALASWASNDGKYHVMELTQRINHYPDVKNHVVAAQIHDANDDIFMLRLETKKLFLEFQGVDGGIATSDYVLGTTYKFKVVVYKDTMKFYFNDALFYTKVQSFSGAYFKAGVYTQSACLGSKKVTGESCDAYGEVEIFKLSTFHGTSLPVASAGNVELNTNKLFIQNNSLVIDVTDLGGKGAVAIYDVQARKVQDDVVDFNQSRTLVPLKSTLKAGSYIVVVTSPDGACKSLKLMVP